MAVWGKTMNPSQLTFNPETGTFVDASGKHWIRNLFVEESPVYICTDESVWHMPAPISGYPGHIDWRTIELPPDIVKAIKTALVGILSKTSSGTLDKHRILLIKVSTAYSSKAISENFLANVSELSTLWNDWLTDSDRSVLRNLYKHLTNNGTTGTNNTIYNHLRSWKARHKTQVLRAVLEWNPEKGALTSSELEVLLQEFKKPVEPGQLCPSNEFARIIVRVFISTFRRTSQVLQIPHDGLKRVENSNGNKVAFLVTPGAKAQINAEPTWEPIPIALADEIENYRNRPEVKALADTDPQLLFAATREGERSLTTAASINSFIKAWVSKRKLISPRTGSRLKITMNRLRHTGGTQLAIQGYSRDLIQNVLQHDSASSAQFYIDSVGADTTPIFERIDRKLGGRFSDLKDAFFKGRIILQKQTTKPPIVLPNQNTPSVVGACGNSGICSLHPLLSCYSCMHFLAFKEADHTKVLTYLENESQAWHSAEYGASRGKSLKDFQRIAAGVREVIDQIDMDAQKADDEADPT